MMNLRTLAVFAAALAATVPTVSARQHAPYSEIAVFATSLSLALARLTNHAPVNAADTEPSDTVQHPVTAPEPVKPEPSWPPAGVFRPGGDVIHPKLLKDAKPRYTPDALRAKIQGVIVMEAVVLPNGAVGEVRVVRSLDKRYGLDDEAVKAMRRWRFTPGKKDGVAVPVVVEATMTFIRHSN